MKIVICGSLSFTHKMKEIADKLEGMGFEVQLPLTALKILNKEISVEDIDQEKENGEFIERINKFDAIRAHFELIKAADVILVVNEDKNGIKGYVGNNTFLEIGLAYALHKKIFLLNNISQENIFFDEIKTMVDVFLGGDLNKIK